MDKKQENKMQNKKARPLFIIIMILSLVAGGVFGFFAVEFESAAVLGAIAGGLSWFNTYVVPWGTLLCFAVMLAAFFPLYNKAKKLFAGWDGEDEGGIEKAEDHLSKYMLICNICQILCYFCVGAGFIGSKRLINADDPSWWPIIRLFASVAGLMLLLITMTLTQKKVVDLVKEMNPEKQGSVYDIHFNKKWEGSCDEAEKMMVCRAAYMAYKVASAVCLTLWLVLVLASLLWDISVLGILCVTIIWLSLTVTYCVAAMKLGKPSATGATSHP